MSVAFVGGAAVSLIGGSMAADTAAQASDNATNAQAANAAAQNRLAQQQWDFQQNTYLPKQMANADAQLALNKQITQQSIDNSNYDMGLSKTQNAQAQKSYAYQDQYDRLADDYASGRAENVQANMANANVAQAYENAAGQLQRNQSRMGINPGSGAAAAAQGNMYTQQMLAGAGAQTSAQAAARTKAETMVAVAAGSGNAGFGTGAASGSLANGAINGATYSNNNMLGGLNSVAQTYGSGLGAASGMYGGSTAGWNSSVNSSNNFANAMTGLATGINNSGILGQIGSYLGVPGTPQFGGGSYAGDGGTGSLGGGINNPSALPSDARLKTGVKRVGQTDSGVPIYTYRMKWGGPVLMGVMAQELEKVNPGAVTQHPLGYKMVDYGQVS